LPISSKVYIRELARRYPTIVSVAVHPGIVGTDLISGLSLGHRLLINAGAIFNGGFLQLAQGAYNEIWAATAHAAAVKSGEMYEPVGILTKQLDREAKSDDLAEELWAWTEEQLQEY